MKENDGTPDHKLTFLNKILNVYTVIGVILVILATILLITPSLPYLWYRLNSGATEQEIDNLALPVESDTEIPEPAEPEIELPPLDESLPTTNMISIPSIGVNSQIYEGTDPKEALDRGVWRAPEFGTPEDSVSTILAAHRFGYISWSSSFRTTNSFFNLPKTDSGDRVEIIWNQRKYIYEIYKAEDGTHITDYSADLVLYTCRLFNSPVRVFRYAERVN